MKEIPGYDFPDDDPLIEVMYSVYCEGMEAFDYGDSLEDNPYTAEARFINGASMREEWANGWRYAALPKND